MFSLKKIKFRWICETFDAKSNSTKVLEHISNGLATVVQQAFIPTQISSAGK